MWELEMGELVSYTKSEFVRIKASQGQGRTDMRQPQGVHQNRPLTRLGHLQNLVKRLEGRLMFGSHP
jgi:hypothetical protein